MKSYISGLEDEVRSYRGDSPARPPGSRIQLSSPAFSSELGAEAREKLPNVAKIQGIAYSYDPFGVLFFNHFPFF